MTDTSRLTRWDELPLREKQELASALRIGIASPFWAEYRAWLGDLLQDTFRSLIPACTDIPSILPAENRKGRLAGIDQAINAPEAFLADLEASITAETEESANARPDTDTFRPFPDGDPVP